MFISLATNGSLTVDWVWFYQQCQSTEGGWITNRHT